MHCCRVFFNTEAFILYLNLPLLCYINLSKAKFDIFCRKRQFTLNICHQPTDSKIQGTGFTLSRMSYEFDNDLFEIAGGRLSVNFYNCTDWCQTNQFCCLESNRSLVEWRNVVFIFWELEVTWPEEIENGHVAFYPVPWLKFAKQREIDTTLFADLVSEHFFQGWPQLRKLPFQMRDVVYVFHFIKVFCSQSLDLVVVKILVSFLRRILFRTKLSLADCVYKVPFSPNRILLH